MNLYLTVLITLGGLGFIVLEDAITKKSFKRLTPHSKIVLLASSVLLIGGAVSLWLTERSNMQTIARLSGAEQLLTCLFQSVTARTAGFNTLPIERLTESSLLVLMVLMVIGASPTSTGGGIKTTTAVVVLMETWTLLRGKTDIVIFERLIGKKAAHKAFAILVLAFSLITAVTLFISTIENLPLIKVLFEVVSAFGTVGLSVGITKDLSVISKILLILTMFAGRVGILTFAMLLMSKPRQNRIIYPEVKIIIG